MSVESLKRLANRRGYALKMVNEKFAEALNERDEALARVAALEAERDAYKENSEMMNDAASRYLRRAEQAEAQFEEPPSRDYHNEIRAERDAAVARADEYKRETEMAYADMADALTALRFYADANNHKSGDVSLDGGNLARATLSRIDELTGDENE